MENSNKPYTSGIISFSNLFYILKIPILLSFLGKSAELKNLGQDFKDYINFARLLHGMIR
jgi:hypothetical protein